MAILFADLAGFTRLTSENDPEAIRDLLGRYFAAVDGAVVRAGGAIDKHIGDATMAVFGAPVAHGNDIERAVRAAFEIHDAMAALSAEVRSRAGGARRHRERRGGRGIGRQRGAQRLHRHR